MKQTSTSIRKNNNSQYVADWILYKIYSEIHKEVLLLQFIARLIILLTLQQLYKTLSKQYYWSPQEWCSLIKRFYIVIDWNSTELHRVNSPVGIIHTVSTTPRRKDEVAMPDPLTWRTLKRLSALPADTPSQLTGCGFTYILHTDDIMWLTAVRGGEGEADAGCGTYAYNTVLVRFRWHIRPVWWSNGSYFAIGES